MNQQTNMAAKTAADLVQAIATRLYGDAGAGVTDLIALNNLVVACPLRQFSEAATLRHAAAVLYMWEDDPNLTGYMGDFKDACNILELLAEHAPAAQTGNPVLWAMHLQGPDDVHAAPSKVAALEVANAINREFARSEIKPYAVVVHWTGSAEEHRASAAAWDAQWTQRDGLFESGKAACNG